MTSALLPAWPPGTPATLATASALVIPVSTALRAGDARIVFALGRRRRTLAVLRDDPVCALCVLAAGVAFTAAGKVAVIAEQLQASDSVAGLELRVESVQDHLADGRTEILAAARWRWREAGDAERDADIRAELAGL